VYSTVFRYFALYQLTANILVVIVKASDMPGGLASIDKNPEFVFSNRCLAACTELFFSLTLHFQQLAPLQ
jgi:hypothetical protein